MVEQRHQHALPNGYLFEGYRIEGILGAGSFGVTYMAREVAIDRAVAIKEYLPSGIATRDAKDSSVRPISSADAEEFEWGLERFQKEAAVLVTFRHPNIVPVFRYFEANSTAYMVMEYQQGKSLAQILQGGKKYSEREIYDIIDPLIEGLERVHANNFLHRDIKPGNIYVRDDGSPVLIDFGAARQAMGQRSQNLTRIFTPGYAPHEQYETGSNQGPWTDIYAIGAVMYVMVADQPPVDAPTRLSAQARKQPDPMKPAVEAARPGFSDQLLATIDRSLSIMEDDRPQSIAEFRGLLLGREGEEVASGMIPATLIADRKVAGPARWTPRPPPSAPSVGPGGTPGGEKRPMRMLLFAALGVVALAGAGLATYVATDGFGGPSSEEIARRNIEEAAKRRAEAQRREEEAAKRREEEAAKRKAAEAAKRKAAEAAKRKAAEAAKRKAAEAAKRKAAEAAKRKAAEAAKRKAEAETKKNPDAEAKRKAEARKKAEAKARRQEAAARKRAEEEAKRREAAKKKAETEGARRAAEARKKTEEARKREEAAARAKTEAEARRKAEIEARRRAAAQRRRAEEARRKAEEERKRQQASTVSTRVIARFAGRSIGFRRNARDYAITFSRGGAVKGTYGEEYAGDASNTQYFSDAGSWSVRGGRLCVKWRSWDGARNICYAVSRNSLSGGGVLSGNFRYR